MQPTPTNDITPAGVVVAGFGGTGMTVVNHLLARFGPEALPSLGIELIGLDSIRDDPRRLIPPLDVGIDTGPASTSFVPVPADHVTVLHNIANGTLSVPYVTSADADRRLAQPRVSEGGFGTDPVCGALAFDAAPDGVIDNLVRRVEGVATAPNRPVQIVLVGGMGGGTGASMLSRVASRLRGRLRDPHATVWVIGIMAGPYEPRFGGDDVFALRARSVASTRELYLLPDQAADLVFVVDHLPAIGDREPLDGALSSVATFIELLATGVADIHGRSTDWAGRDLRDTSRRERLGVIGAAAVRGEPHVWLELVAQETAEQVARRINTGGDHTDADAITLVQRLIGTFAPLRHANEISSAERSRPAPAVDPALTSSSTILGVLSAGDEPPPLPTDLHLTLGRGRLHRETVTMTTDTAINDDLGEVHAWARAENRRASTQLRRALHTIFAETLGGAGSDGHNLNADPDVVVVLDTFLDGIHREFSNAARRLADDFQAITGDPDQHPVRLAGAARDAAEERLPDVSRPRNRAEYLAASDVLREARAWEVTVGDLRAGFELLVDVVDRVRRLIIGARRSIAGAGAAAQGGAATALRVLSAQHARYDTTIVPTPDTEGVRRTRELLHDAGSPDRPVVEDILGDLRIRFTGSGDDAPETWGLQLCHPEIAGFDDTAGALAVAAHGQILPIDDRLLPALAAQRFGPVVDRLSLADQLGLELERDDRLGPSAARLPDADIAEALRPILDELVATSGPLARISTASIDGRTDRDPATHEMVFRPRRSATGLTPIGLTVQRVLDGADHTGLVDAVPIDWPVLGRMTVALRVSDSRLSPLNECLPEYHERASTFHISRPARRAFDLERLGIDLHLMNHRRFLMPEVVRLFDDEETLIAAGSLIALGDLETIPDPTQPDGTPSYAVSVPRMGETVVATLAPVTDPEAALFALFAHGARDATAVVRARWRTTWEQMNHAHGPAGAREARRSALKTLEPRLSDTERARDLYLALRLLIIERDAAAAGTPGAQATTTTMTPPAPRPSPAVVDPRSSVNPNVTNGSGPPDPFASFT